jgi:isopentenyl-diphosphate delta-isomerase
VAKEQKNIPGGETDPNAANRKRDHIDLAFKSRIEEARLDSRFYYEPMLAAHPENNQSKGFYFVGRKMQTPIWISSMTGGTEKAYTINKNLAKACKEFGMGMGLGSCRSLLSSDVRLKDFDFRKIIGDDLPFYANLGVAQVEQLFLKGKANKIGTLIDRLNADGLILHINPFQEWLQPEGDRFLKSPTETLKQLIDEFPELPVIVKEVGQGFGPESLKALLQLPLAAIEFGAAGGTNFAQLEMLRDKKGAEIYSGIAKIGHSATEMVGFLNTLKSELGDKVLCKQIIISGGVKDFLDGYYLIKKSNIQAIYGQASAFLKYAQDDYKTLHEFVETQIKGLALAETFLTVR